MLRFYRALDGRMAETDAETEARFIRAVSPTDTEISRLSSRLCVEKEILHLALEEGAVPRVEKAGGATLLVCAVPVAYRQGEDMQFDIFPLSLVFTERGVVSVASRSYPIVEEWLQRPGIAGGSQGRQALFFLQLLTRLFEQHLHRIEKMTSYLEKQAGHSPRNRRLRELLHLEASLVHYSTALRENGTMLESLLFGRHLLLSEEDRVLFEHVRMEMARTGDLAMAYTHLVDGMIGTMSSIVSNNLNRMLRVFSVILIVLAIALGAFFLVGLRTPGFSAAMTFLVLAVSVICMGAGALVLHRSGSKRQVS